VLLWLCKKNNTTFSGTSQLTIKNRQRHLPGAAAGVAAGAPFLASFPPFPAAAATSSTLEGAGGARIFRTRSRVGLKSPYPSSLSLSESVR
jgi:hypothetical protein